MWLIWLQCNGVNMYCLDCYWLTFALNQTTLVLETSYITMIVPYAASLILITFRKRSKAGQEMKHELSLYAFGNPGRASTNKRTAVLPNDLVKSRSHEIGCYNDRIILTFDRQLGSTAVIGNAKLESRGFETWDLRVRRPSVYPGSKVHVAQMGPTWVLSAPGRPHVGPMNLAIWVNRGTDCIIWIGPLHLTYDRGILMQ